MNQRIKTTVAVLGLILYAMFCISRVDGHDNGRPHEHADMIVVSTQAFNNIAGVTNDTMTNANLQTVLDAMDNSTLPTASNIVVNTNNFGYFAPTNNTLQVLLDWEDDHAQTNVSSTNIYMTSVQSSNAFILSANSNQFILSSGGQVSNQHMAANSVASSNISDGTIAIADVDASYLKMPRIAGYDAQGGNAICVACGSAAVGVVNTTQVTRSTLFGIYAYLAMTNVAVGADPLSLMYISAQISSNGTVWQTVDVGSAQVGFYTNSAAGGINFSSPAQIHWFVPASNYYKIEATAGSSLAAHQRWTCLWQRTFSVPTGP